MSLVKRPVILRRAYGPHGAARAFGFPPMTGSTATQMHMANCSPKHALLQTETISWLHKALDHFQLSPRGYHRMLRVARTIADLEGSDTIEKPHLSEALSFRPFPASGETAKQAG